MVTKFFAKFEIIAHNCDVTCDIDSIGVTPCSSEHKLSLALHYWMGDVHHCSGLSSPKWPILCRVGRQTLLYHTIPYHLWYSRVCALSVIWRDVEKATTLTVAASAQLPLPLQFVNSDIHIRPSSWSLQWCLTPVRWQMVAKSAEPYNCDYSCDMLGGPSHAYRYYSLTHWLHAVREGVFIWVTAWLQCHSQ